MAWWYVDPLNSAVILTSTTKNALRKRVWPTIVKLFRDCPGLPGSLVDSKTTLQYEKGNDKNGIFALAVKDGNTSKAAADIQGIHAKRILVIIDEATDCPEAIFEVLPNLQKGCTDFRVIVIGNASNKLDPHGFCCQPKGGWGSINIDHEEWATRGVDKWGIPPGICLHFDGFKSPNVKAGKNNWPYIYTTDNLEADKKTHGTDSIAFWKYTRGFWAPEGFCRTIFSETLVEKFDGQGSFKFYSKTFPIAALDPAFGGDRCILRFGTMGDIDQSKRLGLQLGREVEIKLSATSPDPIHYQISKRVIDECRKEGVAPHNFAIDATGEGGGLADIISQEWSNRIVRVEFGGSPSDMPCSEDDPVPAKERYDRKVTELWYSARQFLMAGLLKGLKTNDIIEACSREYNDEKRKIKLDTKDDCKAKLGHSPDSFDAIVMLIHLARSLGASGSAGGSRPDASWMAKAIELDSVYQ